MSKNRLIQDEPTMWNTTFYTLQRLLEQKKAVIATSEELDVPVKLINAQWLLAEKVVKILQVYEEATRGANGNYPTASVIIPIVNSIQKFLEIPDLDHRVKRMKEEMLASLKRRDQDIESKKYFLRDTNKEWTSRTKGIDKGLHSTSFNVRKSL